jgi:hypothetical protein
MIWWKVGLMARTKAKESAPSRDRNRDLRITCIAAIPRSTTELKKLLIDDVRLGLTVEEAQLFGGVCCSGSVEKRSQMD